MCRTSASTSCGRLLLFGLLLYLGALSVLFYRWIHLQLLLSRLWTWSLTSFLSFCCTIFLRLARLFMHIWRIWLSDSRHWWEMCILTTDSRLLWIDLEWTDTIRSRSWLRCPVVWTLSTPAKVPRTSLCLWNVFGKTNPVLAGSLAVPPGWLCNFLVHVDAQLSGILPRPWTCVVKSASGLLTRKLLFQATTFNIGLVHLPRSLPPNGGRPGLVNWATFSIGSNPMSKLSANASPASHFLLWCEGSPTLASVQRHWRLWRLRRTLDCINSVSDDVIPLVGDV